jgi:uncharacterized membrane protein
VGDADASAAPHVRRIRERAYWERARESLLVLPLTLLIGGVLLALAARAIDRHTHPGWLSTFDMSPDAATTLLSTIAGATITTAGVVFSLLVVSLQLASGQFSPRVLRTFWRDRVGQVLIGLLLATFAYCVLSIGQVNASASHAPTVTMLIAVLLALASILAIVSYLNRITRQQYVGIIMKRIQDEALALVKELPYAHRVGSPTDAPDVTALGPPLVVGGHTDGWVQQISQRAMLAAVPAGSVVQLETRVGSYIVRDEPLARVWPRPNPATAEEVVRLIAESAVVGPMRTMQQDIDFALRQLNDIGLRALSPAVNDQTTAIEVILRISSIMRPLLLNELPSRAHRDSDDRILLTPWNLDHAGYVRHAFAQVRVYAAAHPQVSLALIRSMRMLRATALSVDGDRLDAIAVLDKQIEATIADAAKAGMDEIDLEPLRHAALA